MQGDSRFPQSNRRSPVPVGQKRRTAGLETPPHSVAGAGRVPDRGPVPPTCAFTGSAIIRILIAALAVAIAPAAADTRYEEKGVVLEGTARIVTRGAATCLVFSEEEEGEASRGPAASGNAQPVLQPLENVPQHVVQPARIRCVLAHGMRAATAVTGVPRERGVGASRGAAESGVRYGHRAGRAPAEAAQALRHSLLARESIIHEEYAETRSSLKKDLSAQLVAFAADGRSASCRSSASKGTSSRTIAKLRAVSGGREVGRGEFCMLWAAL